MRDTFGCYLHGNTMPMSFIQSMARLREQSQRLLPDVWTQQSAAGNIFAARNELTRQFLYSEAEWLWMVDSDMGFAPDSLDRLLATAEEERVSIAGALCFSWQPVRSDGMGGNFCRPQPTIYGHDGYGFKAVTEYKRDSAVRAAGTGAAFLVIHRRAIKAMGDGEWWTPVQDGREDQWLGEDLSFFLRANLSGQRLIVDTSVKTTHTKVIHLSEEHYDLWEGSC